MVYQKTEISVVFYYISDLQENLVSLPFIRQPVCNFNYLRVENFYCQTEMCNMDRPTTESLY